MNLIRNREIRGILAVSFIILILGLVLAGMSGMFDGLGFWFAGPRALNKIIFVSDRSGTPEIYSMGLDGADQKQLTTGAKVGSDPAISNMGNRIVFCGLFQGSSQILRVGAGGGTAEPIARGDGRPAFSPDGNKLSYMASGKVEVAGMNGDNPDPVLPTHAEIHESMSDPLDRGKVPTYTAYAWGPDSNSMVGVTRDKDGNDALIYLPKLEEKSVTIMAVAKDAAGRSLLVLSSDPNSQAQPLAEVAQGHPVRILDLAWAAHKPVMAAAVEVNGNIMLLKLDAEQGKCAPVLAVKGQQMTGVAVSPDGSVIVFAIKTNDKKLPSGLMKIDLSAGSGGVVAQGVFEKPVYSPKGDKILAIKVGDDEQKRDVVSIDPASGRVKQLTNDGHSITAIWSPAAEK